MRSLSISGWQQRFLTFFLFKGSFQTSTFDENQIFFPSFQNDKPPRIHD
jgi:hypothetical protein